MSWLRRLWRWRRRGVLPVAGIALLAAVTVALVAWAVVPREVPISAPAPQPASTYSYGEQFLNLEIIGDSFTGGSEMGGNGDKGWAKLVQNGYPGPGKALLNLITEGGAGYATQGLFKHTLPEDYAAQEVRGQDVVVVFAGLNDSQGDPATVGPAASKLYAAIKVDSPNATLIVVGAAWPRLTPPAYALTIRDQIKAAAAQAGAQFIDPIADGWFEGPDHALIGSDGTHPVDAGHKYMADKLAPVIDAALKAHAH